jgi:hypothetical protein
MLKRYTFFPTIWVFVMLFWALPALAEMIVDTAWVRRYNGPGNSHDYANAITVDGSGITYVTGGSNGDYTTIKYYPNGDTAWVRIYNGPGDSGDEASAIAVDGSGNVYVTGRSMGSGPGEDYATIKYYPNGDTAWVRRYNGPGDNQDEASAIAVDGFGNVYVTGRSVGIGVDDDYATIKYYPNGDTAWVRRYCTYAMTVDSAGNVYVTGWSSGDGKGEDYTTTKYYPNGDTAWVRRYNGPDNGGDFPEDIAVDGSGNIYVTGESEGSGTDYDYATVKYYPNGDTAWVRRYNGPGNWYDMAYAIVVDGSGNAYVTGISGNGLDDDYATIKYYPNGDTAWVRRYNGPGNGFDYANAIALDDSGNVYVTGVSWGNGTWDDYATIKYYPNGDSAWVRRYNGPDNLDDYSQDIAIDGSGNIFVTGYDCGRMTDYDYATIKYVQFLRGDANGDGGVDVGDVVLLINYLFKNGPDPLLSGYANCDGIIDVGDIVYLINYLFKGGPQPNC